MTHAKAYAGMVNTFQPHNTISKLNKGSAVIQYGKGVEGDGNDGAKLVSSGTTAAKFMGVVMYEINREQATGAVAGAVPKRDMTVITMGQVWVKSLTAAAKDDDVYVRVGSTGTGDFANAAGSSATASVKITNAKYLSSCSAGELVQISLGVGG